VRLLTSLRRFGRRLFAVQGTAGLARATGLAALLLCVGV
jgi:hypothetical protein